MGQFLVSNLYPDIEDAEYSAVKGARIIVTLVTQES
jgi:hypothetical protein